MCMFYTLRLVFVTFSITFITERKYTLNNRVRKAGALNRVVVVFSQKKHVKFIKMHIEMLQY